MLDKEKLLKHFGSNLKEARNLKGMSQEDLALSLGFDRTYISMLERGKRNPSLFTIYKIAYYLEVKTIDLVSGIK
jgi:transcriptional regulator with XRE-family HTH domain